MEVICVIYNSKSDKILVSENKGKYSLPSVRFKEEKINMSQVVSHLQENYNIVANREDFTEIFHNCRHKILLLRRDSFSQVFGEWKVLRDLKSLPFNGSSYIKFILNYFFRLEKLKIEPLFIYLKCSDKYILDNCKRYILRRNSGILDNGIASGLGIFLSDQETGDTKIINIYSGNSKEENIKRQFGEINLTYEGSITELYKKVMLIITDMYAERVGEATQCLTSIFYGITGLSESGKSYYSRYIDSIHSGWNLKIRFFIENSKYLIDEDILPLKEVVSIKLMIDFACYHYFKSSFIIESVYSKSFHDNLQIILKDNYKLIYLDAPQEVRISRSLDSMDEFINKENKKEKLGVNLLKQEADYLIDNSGLISETEKAIDQILGNFGE